MLGRSHGNGMMSIAGGTNGHQIDVGTRYERLPGRFALLEAIPLRNHLQACLIAATERHEPWS